MGNNPINGVDPDGREWVPDENGNLVAEAGDNALTLAEYLDISFDEANAIYSNLGNWEGGGLSNYGVTDIVGLTLIISSTNQRIGNIADFYLGSTLWNYDVAKGNFPANTNKCNLFCYDVTTQAGASPGLPNGNATKKFFGATGYPPTAAQWADTNYNIPGWTVVTNPQRGDIAAQAINYSDATGHVTTVSRVRTTVGTVHGTHIGQGDWGFRPAQSGQVVFRRWTGN